jgi:hypothetical protein
MDPLHMVMKIPAAGETASNNGSLTSLKEAEMGVLSMAVHSMSFTLMAEKASIGGESDIHTLGYLAVVRSEMGIQVFASNQC